MSSKSTTSWVKDMSANLGLWLLGLWFKGSLVTVIFVTIGIFQDQVPPMVQLGGVTTSWIASYLLALSPVGGLVGILVLLSFWLALSMFSVISSAMGGDFSFEGPRRRSSQVLGTPGFLRSVGKRYDKQGFYQGRVDDDGTIRDKQGFRTGSIDQDGTIRDKQGFREGRIGEDGTLYDKQGFRSGKIAEDGTVYDKQGFRDGKVKG